MTLEEQIASVVQATLDRHLQARMELDPVMNLTEAARHLKVGPNTVKALVDAGELPCLRSGSQYRFGLTQLDGLLARNVVVKEVG